MSANNQILIHKHKDHWLVFDSVSAESWSDKNEISLKEAEVFTTEQEALNKASEIMYGLEWPEVREYGIQFKLAKDGKDITVIDD